MAGGATSAEEKKEYCRQRKSEEIEPSEIPEAYVHN
jgi:hypothetical protein